MLMGWTLDWVLGMCGFGSLVQIIIIFFIILFFESISLYKSVIYETVYCLITYIFIMPHSWKIIFEKLAQWENILCIIIWVKEREKTDYFAKYEPCVLLLCAEDHFILRNRCPWVSKYHRLCEEWNLF